MARKMWYLWRILQILAQASVPCRRLYWLAHTSAAYSFPFKTKTINATSKCLNRTDSIEECSFLHTTMLPLTHYSHKSFNGFRLDENGDGVKLCLLQSLNGVPRDIQDTVFPLQNKKWTNKLTFALGYFYVKVQKHTPCQFSRDQSCRVD